MTPGRLLSAAKVFASAHSPAARAMSFSSVEGLHTMLSMAFEPANRLFALLNGQYVHRLDQRLDVVRQHLRSDL